MAVSTPTKDFRIDLNIKLQECTRFGTNHSNVIIWGYSQVKTKLRKTSTRLDDVEQDLRVLQTTAIRVLPVHIKSMWDDYDLNDGTFGGIALALIMTGIFESKELILKEFADIATLLALSPNDETRRVMMAKKYGEFAPPIMLAVEGWSLVPESRGRSAGMGLRLFSKNKKEPEKGAALPTPGPARKPTEEEEVMNYVISLVETYTDMIKGLLERAEHAKRLNINVKHWTGAQIALSLVATGLGITATVMTAGAAPVALTIAVGAVGTAVSLGKAVNQTKRDNQGLDGKKKFYERKGEKIIIAETVGKFMAKYMAKKAAIAAAAMKRGGKVAGEAATESGTEAAFGSVAPVLGLVWNIKQFRDALNFVPMLNAEDASRLHSENPKLEELEKELYGKKLRKFSDNDTSWSVINQNLEILKSRLSEQIFRFYKPCLDMISNIEKTIEKFKTMDEAISLKKIKKMKPILKLVNSHVLTKTNALLEDHVEKVKEKVKNASKEWLKGGFLGNPMFSIHITKLYITNSQDICINKHFTIKEKKLVGIALIRKGDGPQGLDEDGSLRLEFPIFLRNSKKEYYEGIFNTACDLSHSFRGGGKIRIEVLIKDEAIFIDGMKKFNFKKSNFKKSDEQEDGVLGVLPGCMVLDGFLETRSDGIALENQAWT